ncbi:MAG: aspartate aminotransferase family protein [archaeon]|nr:aspartate aminotransferase family protein [archaeon]
MGSKTKAIIARDKKIISSSYTREFEDFAIEKAKDCFVWDADGKKYLDFSAAVSVANAGHTNPFVVKAIQKQLKRAIHIGFADFYSSLPVEFCEKLSKELPSHLNNFFLSNSGTESIEAAFKAARWHSKKLYTVAFSPCFHGRTMGSLSLTNARPIQRERFGPFLPVKHVPYAYTYRFNGSEQDCVNNSLNELEKVFKETNDNVASVFLEPISGEPGYIVPPTDWVKGIRKLCDEHNALLVADEVQSGCNRTGKFLAIENFEVSPDIVCLSKSIANGIPFGVTIADKKTFDWPAGAHANTFGGNLIASAAGIAVLDFMKKKKLALNALKRGKQLMKGLEELQEKFELIGDVRGKGLMIGAELVENRKTKTPAVKQREKILQNCLRNGLILLPAGMSTIRFCPPLTISSAQIDKGLNILESSFKSAR